MDEVKGEEGGMRGGEGGMRGGEWKGDGGGEWKGHERRGAERG